MREVLIALIASGLVCAIVERFLQHRERMRELELAGGIDQAELVREAELVAIAAAHRADPDQSLELVERVARTVLEDFGDGTLVDPRAEADA